MSTALARWCSLVRRQAPGSGAALIVGLGLVLYLPGLGAEILRSPLEVKYALVAREMLRGTSPLLVPHLFGVLYPDKPPLHFWATAAIGWLAGDDIGEVTARLPAALAAIAGLLLVGRLGTELFGRRAGLLAACALATSNLFFWYARQGHPDQLLIAFVTLACLALWRSLHAPRGAAWTSCAFAAMGLAVLSKGLIGLVLPLLAALSYLALTGPPGRIAARLRLGLGLPVFLAVVLAWYGPAVAQNGRSYLLETLVRQQLARYAHGWEHVEPWYYYAGQFPVGFFPWVLFLPSAIVLGWRASRRPAAPEPAFLFPLGWFASGFVFLTLSSTKREAYLLPLYPAAALMVGWLWAGLPAPFARWVGVPLKALSATAATVALVLAVLPRPLLLRHLDPASRADTLIPATAWQLGGVVLLALGGAVGLWWAWQRGRAVVAFGLLVAVQALALLAVATIRAPQYERRFPIRSFAARVERAVPPGPPILTTLREHSLLVAFYFRRPVALFDADGLLALRTAGPQPHYALVDGDEPLLAQPGVGTLLEASFGGRRVVLVSVNPPSDHQ